MALLAVQNVNPIFNLLPDILSSLGAEQVLHLCIQYLELTCLVILTTMLSMCMLCVPCPT